MSNVVSVSDDLMDFPGQWLTSQSSRTKVHLVASVRMVSTRARGPHLGAQSVCGNSFTLPRFHVEPPDIEFCDICLLFDFDRYVVYRLLGNEGRAIYIGFSNDLLARLEEHRTHQWWWPQVVSCDYRFLPDEKSARDGEAEAINRERPIYNQRLHLSRLTRAA